MKFILPKTHYQIIQGIYCDYVVYQESQGKRQYIEFNLMLSIIFDIHRDIVGAINNAPMDNIIKRMNYVKDTIDKGGFYAYDMQIKGFIEYYLKQEVIL